MPATGLPWVVRARCSPASVGFDFGVSCTGDRGQEPQEEAGGVRNDAFWQSPGFSFPVSTRQPSIPCPPGQAAACACSSLPAP